MQASTRPHWQDLRHVGRRHQPSDRPLEGGCGGARTVTVCDSCQSLGRRAVPPDCRRVDEVDDGLRQHISHASDEESRPESAGVVPTLGLARRYEVTAGLGDAQARAQKPGRAEL